MTKSMEIKSAIDWNNRNTWEQICEKAGYSPEKIGAYVRENLLRDTKNSAVQEPAGSPADISAQNNPDGGQPLTMDELQKMNDGDVWIVGPAGADGSRRIMHALVEFDQASGNVWLTNSLGGRAIFDSLNEAGAVICRKKPQAMQAGCCPER
ncbi:MAG: hypothetical protein K2O18_11510 [Oscillospiraceae bacterium]|nr:hypothetical protein [Oscillospiraceae bacterium]